MYIQILSDLHIDSYARRNRDIGSIPQTNADIILIAGDTCNGDQGMLWLQEQAKKLGKPIFTISGNHEYFGEDVFSFDSNLSQWDNYQQPRQSVKDSLSNISDQGAQPFGSGLKFLQCEHIDIGDIRLLGCTLWTDYQFQATPETIPNAMEFMRDYQSIKVGGQLFSPRASVHIHKQHRKWLYGALIEAHKLNKKTVVMTHHSISAKSVSDKYAGFPSNAAFVSDLSTWMQKEWSPALWIHGHTHEAFDYYINDTRVVVNPRAYPDETSSTKLQFDWAKVVKI